MMLLCRDGRLSCAFVASCTDDWRGIAYGNQRLWEAHSDEDLVGLIFEAASSCHIKAVAANTLFKWQSDNTKKARLAIHDALVLQLAS